MTRADIDAGKLIYTPPANANGSGYASFTFKVNDGTDDSASAYTLTIDVTAVAANADPTASDRTVTTNEDTDYTFAAADFNFADTDSGRCAVEREDRDPARAGQGHAGAQRHERDRERHGDQGPGWDAGNLKYTPPANANGSAYASFTFKVNDGTDDSGLRLHADPRRDGGERPGDGDADDHPARRRSGRR